MEYPFGHPHHHRRRDDDNDPGDYPPPPPPSQPTYGGPYPHPPPEHHPPPPTYGGAYHHPAPESHFPPPPAQVTGVYHSSHSRIESPNHPPEYPKHTSQHFVNEEEKHHFQPHMPAFVEGHFHGHNTHLSEGAPGMDFLGNKPTYRVYCKAGGDEYSLAIRDHKVVLTRSDSSDSTQHWIKDERYSTKVKDEEGFPSFALVNKATGQAVKHSIGGGYPVQLISYKPDVFDESILWTESKELGHGFRSIRMVNNIRLSMDAFHGDKDHGGVHDGTTVVLYECWKGDNQQWKIVPY